MVQEFARRLGITLPEQLDWVTAGAAALAILVAGLIGWVVGRYAGPRLARLWERRAGVRAEGIGARLCAISRYAATWLLLSVALGLYHWPPLASLLLGLFAGGAAALAVVNIVRGLHVMRPVAWLLGGALFVAVLADAVGGLAMMTATLDGIAVMAGTRRLSLLTIIQIAVSLAVLYLVVRLANRVVAHSIRNAGSLDPTQRLLAQKLAGIAIVVIAFFIGLNLTGIDLTALAVFSGALGLAVGFGLQKTIGNLFAGIILLMDRSIKPGDVIVVGDSFGSVSKIGVRAVSVITRDGKEHLIPNEDLMTREVENWSYSAPEVRIHIPVGVAYDCDLALAQKLMIDAAMASSRVLKVPKPNVWLREFGDNSVDHDILVWISDPEAGVGNVRSEILNRLWRLFRENGIEIPFPQRDIRMKAWPGGKDAAAAPTEGSA
jgi:small-conductance mechanosensitive channel